MFRIFALIGVALLTALLVANPALAQDIVGAPTPWQLGFQDAASPVKERIYEFHSLLLVIIFAISLFVLALLGFVVWRFREQPDREPSKTTHNVLIEVVWTAVPVLILIIIAVPSFSLIYYMDRNEEAEMTVKVTGWQWYWTYNYQDHEDYEMTAIMLQDDELAEGQPRLLATDENLVLPTDTTIRVLVTAADVLHSWAMPSLGVKRDAVPGRLNETWLRIREPGMYYGQCSEICGEGHGFMPSAIHAVPREVFDDWIAARLEGGDGSEVLAAAGHLPFVTATVETASVE